MRIDFEEFNTINAGAKKSLEQIQVEEVLRLWQEDGSPEDWELGTNDPSQKYIASIRGSNLLWVKVRLKNGYNYLRLSN